MNIKKSYLKYIYDYIYKSTSISLLLSNYVLVSKDDLNKIYNSAKINYYFHDNVSNLLMYYQNNSNYYGDLFKSNKRNLYNVLNSFYSETKYFKYYEINNTNNIKYFLSKLKYDHKLDNFLYLKDNFIQIITMYNYDIKGINELIKECYYGFKYINQLKLYIPNFVYTYCFMECTRVKLENNNIISWCDKTQYVEQLFPYVIKERVKNAITLKSFLNKIKDDTNKDEIISNLIFQYYNIDNLFRKFYSDIKISGLNLENVYILEDKNKIPISYYSPNSSNIEIIGTLFTNFILYITKYSNFITKEDIDLNEFNSYNNINVFIDQISNFMGYNVNNYSYIFKNIKNSNINYYNAYQYNVDFLKIKDINIKNIDKFILLFCLKDKDIISKNEIYNSYDQNKLNSIFTGYMINKIYKINQSLINDKHDIIKIYNKYVKFIDVLTKANCFNFRDNLYDLFELKIKLGENILLDENITEEDKSNMIYTIDKSYNKLPYSNYILNFINYLPFGDVIIRYSIFYIVYFIIMYMFLIIMYINTRNSPNVNLKSIYQKLSNVILIIKNNIKGLKEIKYYKLFCYIVKESKINYKIIIGLSGILLIIITLTMGIVKKIYDMYVKGYNNEIMYNYFIQKINELYNNKILKFKMENLLSSNFPSMIKIMWNGYINKYDDINEKDLISIIEEQSKNFNNSSINEIFLNSLVENPDLFS